MNRIALVLSLAFLAACGSADHGSSNGTTETTTTTTTTTSSGDDTTSGATQSDAPQLVVGTDACTTDADCVPGGCCHATSCVARANAPACGESVCTADCRFGTLDCGGGCLCHQGYCAAQLSQAPNIPGVTDVQ